MRMTTRARWLVGLSAALLVASATPSAASGPTQNRAPNVKPGVCDQYAGDPAPGTVEWQARDANNVSCDYQRTTDADANPAFRAKTTEQVALEVAEFQQTLAE